MVVNQQLILLFWKLMKPIISFLTDNDTKTFVDIINQDHTAHSVQSDYWCTLSTFFIPDYNELFIHLAMEVYFLANEKNMIYLISSERVKIFEAHKICACKINTCTFSINHIGTV